MHNPVITLKQFKSRGIVPQVGDVAGKKVSTTGSKDGVRA